MASTTIEDSGVVFPDATVQSTAGLPLSGGTLTGPVEGVTADPLSRDGTLATTEYADNADDVSLSRVRTSETGSLIVPGGTNSERDTPEPGYFYFRFNTDSSTWEGWNGTQWAPVAGSGAVGGEGNPIMFQHDSVVTADFTVKAGKNSGSFGPLEFAPGVTISFEPGSVWRLI